MKHIIITTLSIILASIANATLYEDSARIADNNYRQGFYSAAIDQYEIVIANGYTSATLYYNLGNAYYRDGKMGYAILNYERALRIRPSMSEARENLTLAESKTADRITELPRLFVIRWVESLQTNVTPATWRMVWLVLLVLVGIAVVLFRLGSNVALRKSGFIGGIAALVILLLTTLLLIGSTKKFNAHSEAIVLDAAMTVKNSPEWQSADKMILHEGTKVTITEELQGWYKIRIADGTTGWCESESVERI